MLQLLYFFDTDAGVISKAVLSMALLVKGGPIRGAKEWVDESTEALHFGDYDYDFRGRVGRLRLSNFLSTTSSLLMPLAEEFGNLTQYYTLQRRRNPYILADTRFKNPRSGKFGVPDLKCRITFGKKLIQCLPMLHATPFTRKKMAKEVENPDNAILSMYDEIHGDKGLCHLLVASFNEGCSMNQLFGKELFLRSLS